jgi:hypothetical protein
MEGAGRAIIRHSTQKESTEFASSRAVTLDSITLVQELTVAHVLFVSARWMREELPIQKLLYSSAGKVKNPSSAAETKRNGELDLLVKIIIVVQNIGILLEVLPLRRQSLYLLVASDKHRRF